jgi:hypothetical protein
MAATPGNLPSRCLVEISQVDAALTSTSVSHDDRMERAFRAAWHTRFRRLPDRHEPHNRLFPPRDHNLFTSLGPFDKAG